MSGQLMGKNGQDLSVFKSCPFCPFFVAIIDIRDADLGRKSKNAEGKMENTNDELVLKNYIKSKKEIVCVIADKIIAEINKKIEDAPLNQLSSVLGTILDKFGADEKDENEEGLLVKVFEDFDDIK